MTDYKWKLTLILRNDMPVVRGSLPLLRHRILEIDLTPEQCSLMQPRMIGTYQGVDQYEEIDRVFVRLVEEKS